MDAFTALLGDHRGYRPHPGDRVYFAIAWPEAAGVDLRRRGPYRDYDEARDVALRVFGRLAHDGWHVMVDECDIDDDREICVVESTPVSFVRPREHDSQ